MARKNQNRGRRYVPRNSAAIAKRALAVANKAQRQARGEKKTFDTTVSSSTINNTYTLTHMTNVAQGDDYNNREGRTIKLASIELNGWAQKHASATDTKLRVMVFIDNEPEGEDPTGNEVLASQSTYALRNPAPHHMRRFKILMDRVYFLNDGKSHSAKVQFYKKLNHKVTYTSSAAGGSGEGALWCLMISNEGTNVPSLNLFSRIRFYD